MQVFTKKTEMDEAIAEWRHEKEHIALVATMGNLHDGHLSLVDLARENAERVVVTVFVNPTQFGDGEDFEDYPRTLERDKRKLRKTGVDVLFAPDVETVYPHGIELATTVTVPGLSDNFCGEFRPGHFTGVTSVVARLFALVQPDIAVFGQKDYQQQLLIRYMVEDLHLPIRIITAPTVREDDGLAMSSRNAYLTDAERTAAPTLFELLSEVGSRLQAGQRDHASLETGAMGKLSDAGFEPEYFAIRRAENLELPDRDCDELVVLTAARLGEARLIDNIVVSI